MSGFVGDQDVPAARAIILVQHLPFLTALTLTRAIRSPERGTGGRSRRRGRPPEVAGLPGKLDEAAPVFGLQLQDYAPDLREELLRYLPHQVARCDVPEGQAVTGLAGGRVHCRLVSAHVGFWDSGAGVLTVRYELNPAMSAALRHVREAVDTLHGTARHRWSDAIIRCSAAFPSIALPAYLSVHQEDPAIDSRPMWVHDTLIFLVNRPVSEMPGFDAVTTFFTDGGSPYTLAIEDRTLPLRLGLTACLIADDEEAARATTRLVETHQAIWTAVIDYDRLLFRELSRMGADTASSLGHLESELDALLRVQRLVGNFTASLSYVPVHLASLDQQLWNALYEAWGLERQLEALDEKLTALKSSYSDTATRLGTRRSRRLADFLLIFTFLSAISTAAGLVTFLQTNLGAPRPTNVRWLLLFMAVAVGFALLLWAVVSRGMQDRRGSR